MAFRPLFFFPCPCAPLVRDGYNNIITRTSVGHLHIFSSPSPPWISGSRQQKKPPTQTYSAASIHAILLRVHFCKNIVYNTIRWSSIPATQTLFYCTLFLFSHSVLFPLLSFLPCLTVSTPPAPTSPLSLSMCVCLSLSLTLPPYPSLSSLTLLSSSCSAPTRRSNRAWVFVDYGTVGHPHR